MPDIEFRSNLDPDALGFTLPEDLDTIYIPRVLPSMRRYFQRHYKLSPEQAKEAADVYLEEYYPETLAHETAHLVLGRIAKEEGRPVRQSMLGYHNPIVNDIEFDAHARAIEKALEHTLLR